MAANCTLNRWINIVFRNKRVGDEVYYQYIEVSKSVRYICLLHAINIMGVFVLIHVLWTLWAMLGVKSELG